MSVNTNIGSSLMKFTFSDESGDIVASFRINPADIKLAKRFDALSDYFSGLEALAENEATIDDFIARNDEIEHKICELLGYDAQSQLFGFVPATTIMEDGRLFVVHVLEKIKETLAPEIDKRKQALVAAVEKYTANYS